MKSNSSTKSGMSTVSVYTYFGWNVSLLLKNETFLNIALFSYSVLLHWLHPWWFHHHQLLQSTCSHALSSAADMIKGACHWSSPPSATWKEPRSLQRSLRWTWIWALHSFFSSSCASSCWQQWCVAPKQSWILMAPSPPPPTRRNRSPEKQRNPSRLLLSRNLSVE